MADKRGTTEAIKRRERIAACHHDKHVQHENGRTVIRCRKCPLEIPVKEK